MASAISDPKNEEIICILLYFVVLQGGVIGAHGVLVMVNASKIGAGFVVQKEALVKEMVLIIPLALEGCAQVWSDNWKLVLKCFGLRYFLECMI